MGVSFLLKRRHERSFLPIQFAQNKKLVATDIGGDFKQCSTIVVATASARQETDRGDRTDRTDTGDFDQISREEVERDAHLGGGLFNCYPGGAIFSKRTKILTPLLYGSIFSPPPTPQKNILPPPHAADNNCVLFSHTRQKTFHPMKIFNHNSSYPLPFPSPCLKKEIKFDILIRLSPPFYLTIFEEKVRIDDPKFRNVSFLSYSPLPNALKWLFFLLLDIEEKMLKDF